jgi:hypothetical protein
MGVEARALPQAGDWPIMPLLGVFCNIQKFNLTS